MAGICNENVVPSIDVEMRSCHSDERTGSTVALTIKIIVFWSVTPWNLADKYTAITTR
jgi:hypothetical protein